jgi:putative addiction module component (TIGR02574 family)
MNGRARKLLEDALKLPPEARAAVAGSLIESLDEEIDEGAEAAWSVEIEKRIQDLDAGRVKPVPWSETRRMILGQANGRD